VKPAEIFIWWANMCCFLVVWSKCKRIISTAQSFRTWKMCGPVKWWSFTTYIGSGLLCEGSLTWSGFFPCYSFWQLSNSSQEHDLACYNHFSNIIHKSNAASLMPLLLWCRFSFYLFSLIIQGQEMAIRWQKTMTEKQALPLKMFFARKKAIQVQ